MPIEAQKDFSGQEVSRFVNMISGHSGTAEADVVTVTAGTSFYSKHNYLRRRRSVAALMGKFRSEVIRF